VTDQPDIFDLRSIAAEFDELRLTPDPRHPLLTNRVVVGCAHPATVLMIQQGFALVSFTVVAAGALFVTRLQRPKNVIGPK
jgi:hypothetical protein